LRSKKKKKKKKETKAGNLEKISKRGRVQGDSVDR